VKHQPRRRFGQHFLESDAVIETMIERMAFDVGDDVLEIGPGEGALTRHLLDAGVTLTVIEIDRDLVASLQRRFPALTIIEGDVLKLDLDTLLTPHRRVVGNLPYNISTPLLVALLARAERLRDMHFLLQKEVVDRLAATPGSKDWGRLSILAQHGAMIEPLFDVDPTSFRPPPKVISTFVRISPRPHPQVLQSRETFALVLRMAFQQRRKTLRNALQSLGIDWERVAVEPHTRPDALDLSGYVRIANQIAERQSNA
jgi:16S rRNA (adenine1518-N6/adenine1519-N6)-dimethyltransferase